MPCEEKIYRQGEILIRPDDMLIRPDDFMYSPIRYAPTNGYFASFCVLGELELNVSPHYDSL